MAHIGRSSEAVERYLRNFSDGEINHHEILEITLCYGLQCLSKTFPVRGRSITCSELRTITGYKTATKQDFHVCKASRASDHQENEQQQHMAAKVRVKPSHAWRDGEVDMGDLPKPRAVVTEAAASSRAESGALIARPPAFDEIDYLTKLLGKPLVCLAWQTFAARKRSLIAAPHELEELFFRVDQRRTVTLIPTIKLPVASFAEFMAAYVMECMRQAQGTWTADTEDPHSGDLSVSHDERTSSRGRRESALGSCRSSGTDGRGRSASASSAAVGDTKSVESTHADTRWRHRLRRPQTQSKQTERAPMSFRNEQSKVQSELHTERQTLLRAKKTRLREMVETERTAAYNTQHELHGMRDGRLAPDSMPVNDITTGAAALEIVDEFMRGPLMDKFG
ncbi:unnamed protein product [Hyaloperonospora brassicae]|uniref:Uncharacterized protein n=1 Tax=Hyaloperonospora brassicae TaxID=162125 RepID=A0AAV0TIH5_HYABA|nr:unnamed protein product [Hyaloperonospora brassicae]